MKKLALLLPFFGLSGCSLRTLALRSTTDLLDRGAGAFYDEPDPQLAREALGSQLKLLEALLRNDPDDRKLLLMNSEGFGGYAFLFLEETEPERAKSFYQRGRFYALRAIARNPAFKGLEDADPETLEKILRKAAPADAPALFWAAFSWGGWINLSKDSAEAVAELPKAVLLMDRVRELAPDFHFAGADLFFGAYYASRPAILGGDVAKAKVHFQEARRRTGGKFLMSYVLEARYYAVATQDKELFKSLLSRVQDLPSGGLPNAGLTDEVAKRRAAELLKKTDDYF